jgi:hypothetical protein
VAAVLFHLDAKAVFARREAGYISHRRVDPITSEMRPLKRKYFGLGNTIGKKGML